MFGFLVFCVFAFLTYLLISYCKVFYYVIQLIKDSFLLILESIDIKRKKNSLIKREIAKSVSKPETNLVINPLVKRKVEVLRSKYPYANEELFNKFLIKYDSVPVYAIEKMEYDIMYSHYKNESSQKTITKRHISEVTASRAFDSVFIFPIVMKFYRIGSDYVLSIENNRTNECIMYQSKSHATLLRVSNEIYDNVSIKKENNSEILINELFNINNYKNIHKL